jgi:hypothetical protein
VAVLRVPFVEDEAVEEPFEGTANPAEAAVAYCSVLVTVSCEFEDGRVAEADTAEDVAEVA